MKKSIQYMFSLPFLKSVAPVFFCMVFSISAIAQNTHDTTSYIQTVDIKSRKIDTILIVKDRYEAPNWHPDNYLVLNFNGKIYKLDIITKKLTEINTGSINLIMDDHGLSPDGKWIAITSNDGSNFAKQIYKFSVFIVPVTGGEPKKITSQDLSFWHGWSPDGKTIAYCGGDFRNLDVYTIPVEGGVAKRLTDTLGLDDGPDYSPDGRYIYFHSYRSGRMQIWRMNAADGSLPEQMTFDENANWFPHPSPDNKWIAFIAYTTDEKQNHPFGKNVKLRLMNPKTKAVKDITPVFYGGAGTINTPSWSPDSRKVAFVSYSVN